jgi:hypothetical protein
MELLHICILASCVIGYISYQIPKLLGYEGENVGVGCLAFVILLPLCGIINWFGSKDPNSFFVRKQLLICCNAEIKEVGTNEYSKGYVVGKGNFFKDNDILCLEIEFRDANGTKHEVYVGEQYLTFGKTRRVSSRMDYEKKYLVKLPKEKTNIFLPKYSKVKDTEKQKDLEELEKYYEDLYESYIFKEEYSESDYDW